MPVPCGHDSRFEPQVLSGYIYILDIQVVPVNPSLWDLRPVAGVVLHCKGHVSDLDIPYEENLLFGKYLVLLRYYFENPRQVHGIGIGDSTGYILYYQIHECIRHDSFVYVETFMSKKAFKRKFGNYVVCMEKSIHRWNKALFRI